MTSRKNTASRDSDVLTRMEDRSAALRAFVKEYEWVHTLIGLFGNFLFFVGSVFFLWQSWKVAGVWLFILGSFAMLLGSMGEALIRWERRIRKREEA
jgi:hypothetical protein